MSVRVCVCKTNYNNYIIYIYIYSICICIYIFIVYVYTFSFTSKNSCNPRDISDAPKSWIGALRQWSESSTCIRIASSLACEKKAGVWPQLERGIVSFGFNSNHWSNWSTSNIMNVTSIVTTFDLTAMDHGEKNGNFPRRGWFPIWVFSFILRMQARRD